MSTRACGLALVFVAAVGMGAAAQAQDGRLRPVTDFAGIRDQAERSKALFGEAGKVLQHPRCVNCHPDGTRPLQGETGYPHQPAVQRGGADGLGVSPMGCRTCHGPANFEIQRVPGKSIPGDSEWSLARGTMAWQNKTLGAICTQVKDPARNGNRTVEQIVHHMQHHALVGWAWNPGAGREKAPGTWEEFGALIGAWAEAGAHCPSP